LNQQTSHGTNHTEEEHEITINLVYQINNNTAYCLVLLTASPQVINLVVSVEVDVEILVTWSHLRLLGIV